MIYTIEKTTLNSYNIVIHPYELSRINLFLILFCNVILCFTFFGLCVYDVIYNRKYWFILNISFFCLMIYTIVNSIDALKEHIVEQYITRHCE